MPDPTTILGIESSCDDTAAAVVTSDRRILSSVVMGQDELHAAFGGVVPEIASRAHVEQLDLAVERALYEAERSFGGIDAIAVTAGPGLIGGVMSGVAMAQGIALATGLPLLAVNHLAGHALTPRLVADVGFPYLMLLVSGGHCQFLIVHGAREIEKIGGTIDDAPGEAFDKTARLLGLPQPGGPAIETEAQRGDPLRFDLPRPLIASEDCRLSFSGLKSAVLRQRDLLVAASGGLRETDRADLAAAFQTAVADVLVTKSSRALDAYLRLTPQVPTFAVAGGVAANSTLQARLSHLAEERGVNFIAPPQALCTDNAAMIAWAGHEQGIVDSGEVIPRPRWPLDSGAPGLVGSGRKGPKG